MPYLLKYLLLTAILIGILAVCGCHRSPVIWGTWTETSVRQVYTTGGTVTSDMTTDISGGVVYTFTVSGGYFSTYSNGSYIYKNNNLLLNDTTHTPPLTVSFRVSTLTDQLLVLQQTDTVSLSPLSTVQSTYTLQPQ